MFNARARPVFDEQTLHQVIYSLRGSGDLLLGVRFRGGRFMCPYGWDLFAFGGWSSSLKERRAQREAEERDRVEREAAQKARDEEEKKRRAEEWVKERRRQRFVEICRTYERQDWSDNPDVLRELAYRDRKKILRDADGIVREYVRSHEDRELVAMLRTERPEIYGRYTARMELLRLAQTLDVLGKGAAPPAPNVTVYEALAVFGDDEFVQNYARIHQRHLLRDRERIFREAIEFHADPRVVQNLKEKASEVYRRFTWEIRAYEIALRESVEPRRPEATCAPAAVVEPEVIDKVRRQEAEDEEQLRLGEARIKMLLSIPDILNRYPELDPHERARVESMLRERLEGQPHGEAKVRVE